MHRLFRDFVRSEDGATAIEYALFAACIAVAAAAAFNLIRSRTKTLYASAAQAFN